MRNHSDQKIVEQYRKGLKGKKSQPKILYPVKMFFKNIFKMNTFSDKRKQRKFIVKMPRV